MKICKSVENNDFVVIDIDNNENNDIVVIDIDNNDNDNDNDTNIINEKYTDNIFDIMCTMIDLLFMFLFHFYATMELYVNYHIVHQCNILCILINTICNNGH